MITFSKIDLDVTLYLKGLNTVCADLTVCETERNIPLKEQSPAIEVYLL